MRNSTEVYQISLCLLCYLRPNFFFGLAIAMATIGKYTLSAPLSASCYISSLLLAWGQKLLYHHTMTCLRDPLRNSDMCKTPEVLGSYPPLGNPWEVGGSKTILRPVPSATQSFQWDQVLDAHSSNWIDNTALDSVSFLSTFI